MVRLKFVEFYSCCLSFKRKHLYLLRLLALMRNLTFICRAIVVTVAA